MFILNYGEFWMMVTNVLNSLVCGINLSLLP